MSLLTTEIPMINDPAGLIAIKTAGVLSALATIVVAVRLTLRKVQHFGWGIDDYLILLAVVNIWAMTACTIWAWGYGLGVHVIQLPIPNMEHYLQALFAYEIFYVFDIGIVKLSILFFYERVFAIERKTLHLLRIIEFIIFLWMMVFNVCMVFQCSPVSYFWTRVYNTPGHCINITALYACHASLNVFTDLVIYIFPIPIVWKLRIPTAQKFGVVAVFLLGAVVVAMSIVRASAIAQIVSLDFTYDNIWTSIWAMLECGIGCIVACLPTIKGLFLVFSRRLSSMSYSISSRARRNNQGYNSSGSSKNWPGSMTIGRSKSSGGREKSKDHYRGISGTSESMTAIATDIRSTGLGSNSKAIVDASSGAIPLEGIRIQHGVYWEDERNSPVSPPAESFRQDYKQPI